MAAVKVDGFDKLTAKWRRMPEATKKAIKFGFQSYMTWVNGYMKEEKLSGQVLNRQTSNLYQKTVVRMGRGGDEARVESAPYGVSWEYGFQIPRHTIVPVNAKALRFNYKGRVVFAKSVTIPARSEAARPWARPAIEETGPERDRFFGDFARKALTK